MLPPFTGWPSNLEEKIKGKVYLANGGYEFAATPITELDENELKQIANELAANAKPD